jgi:hypothetical protein
VVDHEGTSHVWEEQFTSDTEARDAAINALETEGALPSCAATTSFHSVNVKSRGLRTTLTVQMFAGGKHRSVKLGGSRPLKVESKPGPAGPLRIVGAPKEGPIAHRPHAEIVRQSPAASNALPNLRSRCTLVEKLRDGGH